MIKQGADPSYQLQPAIWIDDCLPAGNVTVSGWTQAALTDFLGVLDTAGVQILAIWTGGAFIDPAHTVTCPWFIPTVRKWALKSDDADRCAGRTHARTLPLLLALLLAAPAEGSPPPGCACASAACACGTVCSPSSFASGGCGQSGRQQPAVRLLSNATSAASHGR